MHLADPSNSDEVLEPTRYWTPPIPLWQPLKKTLNSSIRLACVVENRLYQGLGFECEIMILTPANWQQVLKFGKPDFLLIESIWTSATGVWHIGKSSPSPAIDGLLKIVYLAQELSIPTVFWITKGKEYHDQFRNLARHFDYVFCADPTEMKYCQSDGIQAKVLLPCVQPALYNPFRLYEHYDALNLEILFDGWGDLEWMDNEIQLLESIGPYGLNIFESRPDFYNKCGNRHAGIKDYILGCTTFESRIIALKYAKIYLSFEKTLSTSTEQQWMGLEAVSNCLPVIHHGVLPDDDVRKNIVREFSEQDDFINSIVQYHADKAQRNIVANQAWYSVVQNHTFSHRLKDICNGIGKEYNWDECPTLPLKDLNIARNYVTNPVPLKHVTKHRPKVSIIIPIYNKAEQISQCLSSIYHNGYDNLEILCIDDVSTDNSKRVVKDRIKADPRIRLFSNRNNCGAGVARNLGMSLAEGEYLFFIDADDTIAEGTLGEMVAIADNQKCDLVRGKITGKNEDGALHRLAMEHMLHNETKYKANWREEESLWYYWYFSANLYRRQFIEDNRIVFPRNIRNEDPFFLCRCFLAANNITLLNEIVYYYSIGPEQKNKTPSNSFLNGWSQGNFYIYQLLCTQFIQSQFFLIHFPSLLKHSVNAVKHLDEAQGINVLRYLKLMFKNINCQYVSDSKRQPWSRRKNYSDEHQKYINVLKEENLNYIYDYLDSTFETSSA